MTIQRPATGWKLQRVTTHPGEMLREEFLLPLGITQNALAMKIRVPATRIGDIIHGRRAVTPDTALRLAQFFGNSPEFWLNLQQMHDLSKARLELSKEIERDVEAYAGREWIEEETLVPEAGAKAPSNHKSSAKEIHDVQLDCGSRKYGAATPHCVPESNAAE